jgi:NADPH-dependent 2,4-dienoyl-CoA reductase/sulfur reductase-like enzyme
LIVATGAYERGLAVPGWTLPGVITTGAAQTLLRSYDVVPGQRVLLAGNGPLNMQVAVELARRGVKVVAGAELAPRLGPRSVAALWGMATSTPGLIATRSFSLRTVLLLVSRYDGESGTC